MDYQKQAKDFLEKTGTEYAVEFLGRRIHPLWNDNFKRNTFEVTFKRNGIEHSFLFYDSQHKTENSFKLGLHITELESNIAEDIYTVLCCINMYIPDNYEDFCDEFGYDEYNHTNYKTWELALTDWLKVNELWPDVIEELQEIV